MTPDQAIDYLKRNRHLLNVSAIAKEANIAPSSLLNFLSEHVREGGYKRTIPDLKLYALAEVVSKLNHMETINPQEELASLEKQLTALYQIIADKYKKMSKVNDEWRLDGMQSGIDHDLQRTRSIRERLTALRKVIAEEWNSKEKGVKI